MQTPVENPLMSIESFNRQFQMGEKKREPGKWDENRKWDFRQIPIVLVLSL